MDNFKQLLWGQIKSLKPSIFSKQPHFNFITAHCEFPGSRLIAHVRQLVDINGTQTSG